MALTFLEGFEHGVFSNAGGGIFTSGQNYASYCSIVTSPVNNGSYALRMNPAASSLYWYKTVSSTSVFVGSFYVRVASLNSTDTNFLTLNVTNSPGLAFDYVDASNFRIASTYGGTHRQFSANLSYNTWYRVDVKIDWTSSGTIDFQVDGSAATQYSSGATGTYTQANWGTTASGTYDYYLDDIIATNSAGDYPIGGHRIIGYKPGSTTASSSPGSNIKDNGGTVVDDSTNPAYVELDDVPLSGGSDYIQQDGGTSSIYAESYFDQTSETQTVYGVNAFVAYQSASASPANSASSKIRDEDNSDQDIYTGDMSETSRFYKALILAAPSGGWDAGAVNALRFRCGYATDYAPIPRWNAAMIEVAYLVPSATYVYLNGQSANAAGEGSLTKATRKLLGYQATEQTEYGFLKVSKKLIGQAVNDQHSASPLTKYVRLYGSAPAEADDVGLLRSTRSVALSGIASSDADSNGFAKATRRISGAAVADQQAQAEAHATKRLYGSAVSEQQVSGPAKATKLLYGSAPTESVGGALITVTGLTIVALYGSTESGQSAAGLQKATRRLTGSAEADSSASAAAKLRVGLSGASTCEAYAAGRPAVLVKLIGSSTSEAQVAALFEEGVEPPYLFVDVDPRERIVEAKPRHRIVDADPRERILTRSVRELDWRA